MTYQIITGVLALASLAILFLALRILLSKRWLAGFIQGCSGLFLIFFTIVGSLSAYDISSYKVAEPDKNLVTLSFRKNNDGSFTVDFQEASGGLRVFPVSGEQWQLESRMFKWPPLFGAMGLKTGYRLESLRGRYLMLDVERKMAKPPEKLATDNVVDIWNFANSNPGILPAVQAYSSTPGFIPIADGAIFEVALAGTNLAARPLNDVARLAMAGQ